MRCMLGCVVSEGNRSPPCPLLPLAPPTNVITLKPGHVAMAAATDPFSRLVAVLESYRGRDQVIRTLCYGCQLAGGILAWKTTRESEMGNRLLAVSAQLSHCRTVLRLFDDLSMLAYSRQYGLGAKEEDAVVRWLSVFNNLVDQLYYPCEHVAWAADAAVIRTNSHKWWTLSTAFWGLSLVLGILRSFRILFQLRRKLRNCTGEYLQQSQKEMDAQVKSEVLSILSSMADLSNAVHWLPPGFLWAGQFPSWLVGLMGTISSLIGVYQTSVGAGSGAV